MVAKRQLSWLAAAEADVGRIDAEDPAVAKLALRLAKKLEAGTISGVRLEDMSRTGDLSDCFKVLFGVGNPPSHRLTYRQIEPAEPTVQVGPVVEVVEVVAVEQRDQGYVYLLTASRLGRLPAETKSLYNRVHQSVIQRRSNKRL